MKFHQFFLISFCNCILLLCSTSKAQFPSSTVAPAKLRIEFPAGKQACHNVGATKPENCILGALFGKLSLKCIYESAAIPWNNTWSLDWYHSTTDGGKYEQVKGTNDGRVKVFDGQIEISQLAASEIGLYQCKVTRKSAQNSEDLTPVLQELVELQALPFVTPIVKDMTVVEGTTINVTCSVIGKATGVVWKFGDKTMVNGSENNRVTLTAFRGVPNATLLIQHANSTTDRGHYNCTATSPYGYSSNYGISHVRIKSKYAALAPFLGICAEVIILCTIILIYEKKRDKTELEESDTDQGPETKSSPDHGQDSVRYRK